MNAGCAFARPNRVVGTLRPFFGLCLFLFSAVMVCFVAPASAEDTVEIDVVRGDYLVRICERYLQEPEDWQRVADMNGLGNPDLIHPGDRLQIPVIWLRGLPLDGRVTHAQGQVLLEPKSGGLIRPLSEGDPIAEGYRITTGENSEATIEFESGVIIRLRSKTTLRIDQANRKDEQTLLFQMFLQMGKVVSRIRDALQRDSRFELETPSAVAGVRGTRFRCGVDAEKAARYEVLDGVVSVQAEEREVLLPPGTGTVVEHGGLPLDPTPLLPSPRVIPPSSPWKSLPVELELEPVPGAVSYRVVLCLDPNLRQVVRESMVPSHEVIRFDSLPDGEYYMAAAGIDEKGLEGPQSEVVSLQVRIHPLPPGMIRTSGPIQPSGETFFGWEPVAGSTAYRIRIEDSEGEVANIRSDVPSSAAVLMPETPTEYRVDVRAVAPDGYEGIRSEQTSMLVVPPPAPPKVEFPDESSETIRLGAEDSDHGMQYRFQVAQDPDFRGLVYDAVSDDSETAMSGHLEPGEYYVRVALVSGDFQSGFSGPTSFVTGNRWKLFSTILLTMITLAATVP